MTGDTTPDSSRQECDPFSNERHISRKSPQTKVGYEAKILIAADRIAVQRRVVLDRNQSDESFLSATKIKSGGGKRGRVVEFSRASRRTFFARANSIAGLVYMVTLTYPGDVIATSDEAKRHWDRLRRWLIQHHVYGIIVREFQERGAIHYHLLASEHLPVDEVTSKWLQLTGNAKDPNAKRYAVRVKEMYDVAGAVRYLGKREQKQYPNPGQSIGRIWSEFGEIERYSTANYIGDRKAIAPLVRVLHSLERAARRARGKRPNADRGMYGFTTWGAVERAFRTRLPDLLKLFGLSATRNEKSGYTFLSPVSGIVEERQCVSFNSDTNPVVPSLRK